MSDKWMDRLSDYLDGEMPPDERVLLEQHLAEDAECAAALESLRRVVKRAEALDDRQPAQVQRMWAGISERIGATPPTLDDDDSVAGTIVPWRSRRLSISIPQLLAAGIALLLLASGGSVLMRGADARDASGGIDPSGAAAAEATVSFAAVSVTRFDRAVADLAQVLEQEREFLNPETVRIVEENLAIIDRAIERSRQALMQDPESDYLRRHLEQTMRQKLGLLRQITSISSAL